MAERSAARGFAPTLFEKLFDDMPLRPSEAAPLKRLSLDELKDSVARDLEALLNSRGGAGSTNPDYFPLTASSVWSYGMEDFVGLSLANPADCHRICTTIERAIADHEPRLRNTRVTIETDGSSKTSLRFVITALLVVHPAREPVNFDAFLQPTTQQYSVTKSRHIPVPGQI